MTSIKLYNKKETIKKEQLNYKMTAKVQLLTKQFTGWNLIKYIITEKLRYVFVN